MRLSLTEYGEGLPLECLRAASPAQAQALVERANGVIKKALGLRRDALVTADGNLRALGVAGAIRLSGELELEIVPKLFRDGGDGSWRESLFLLSALSRYGNILSGAYIHSDTARRNSLYDIAGRILAREYQSLRRRPIRQYRRERFSDFAIDGEVDFETSFRPGPDGVLQTRVSFDRSNPFNAVIRAAMGTVLPYVAEGSTRQVLLRSMQELGPQSPPPRSRLRLPGRSGEWTALYNLSFDIVSGMGSSLAYGEILSPGFLADTWRIWEWLVTTAIRTGLGGEYAVTAQAAASWGQRRSGGRMSPVKVYPDVTVFRRGDPGSPLFLADAKYKVLPQDGAAEIDRADLYEAFAFCRAAGVGRIFLVYPAAAEDARETGSVSHLADYVLGDVTVSAVQAAFGPIARQGDITALCRRTGEGLLALLWPAGTA